MYRYLTFIACLIGVLLSGLLSTAPAQAAVGAGMYQASIPVETQALKDRDKGMKHGLERVLVRLSGRSDARQEPPIRDALGKASRYLQSFSYEQSRSGQLMLKMQFDPQLIQGLLRRSQLPMWVSGRPTVLLWVLVHEGRNKTIATPQSAPKVAALIEQEMGRRGVPIRWPSSSTAMDSEALRLLDVEAIRQASAPYAEQAIFASSVYVRNSSSATEEPAAVWAGRCLYLGASEQQNVHCRKGSSSEFVATAVDDLADVLSERFSVQILGGESVQLRLVVNDVSDFASYGRALKHLQSNALVRKTTVLEVSPGKVVFELELQGTEQQFQDSLGSQQVLLNDGEAGGFGELHYRLNRRQL